MKSKIPDKQFVFEIPFQGREYSPETTEEDYGSRSAYNSDFPPHVYVSMNVVDQLFQNALTYCYQAQMRMLVSHKEEHDPDKWKETDRSFYKMLEARIKLWEETRKKIKCVRIEEIPQEKT